MRSLILCSSSFLTNLGFLLKGGLLPVDEAGFTKVGLLNDVAIGKSSCIN
jgi:hypothetical protein